MCASWAYKHLTVLENKEVLKTKQKKAKQNDSNKNKSQKKKKNPQQQQKPTMRSYIKETQEPTRRLPIAKLEVFE